MNNKIIIKIYKYVINNYTKNMATMKQKILLLATAFAGLWGTAQAQTLSVNPITVDAEEQAELCVNIEGATSMTALQFNLALPEGFAFKQNEGNYGIELGAATAGHTLSVSELTSGELLVVLYNMNLNTFKDGTLLTLPLVAGAEAGTSNGALSKVRMATTAAESNALDNVNFSATINAAAFELKVSAVGLATMYLNQNAVIPADAEVYIASEVTETSVVLEAVTGVLPANTGVVVRANQGAYTFAYTNDSTSPIANNLFKGTAENAYILPSAGSTAFVLSVVDGEVGMYRAALNDEGKFLNNANKAYLEVANNKLGISDDEVDTSVDGAQLSRGFSFQFPEATGISAVTTPSTLSNTYYDLQGRKVAQPTRGIYIFNGKKVAF